MLIVDDDKLMHELIAYTLVLPKIEFYHAYNGEEEKVCFESGMNAFLKNPSIAKKG